jgi:hypothetical protein
MSNRIVLLFQFTIQKFKDYDKQNYNFASNPVSPRTLRGGGAAILQDSTQTITQPFYVQINYAPINQ